MTDALPSTPGLDEHAQLIYRDLEVLSGMLDDTLRRQVSPAFVDLIHRVRSNNDVPATVEALAQLDLDTA